MMDATLAQDMYKENILEHYKNPQNFGEMNKPTVSFRDLNPLCGDELKLMLKIENEKIIDVKFFGKGCAISQAAASMITEKIFGLTISEAKKIDQKSILEMLNIPIGPVRMKCALLCLSVLKNSLEIYETCGGK